MPTTSVASTIDTALLDAMRAVTTVQVSYAWLGPDTEAEGIFLGAVDAVGGIASIKMGRQHRNETLRLEVICQTYTAAATPADAADANARVLELLAVVEDVCADNPQLGGTGPQVLQVVEWERTTTPFQTGWAARITAILTNTARLT